MPTTPKALADGKGITIHLSPAHLAEVDLEIAEELAKAPAATLHRATWIGYLVRQALEARRAARQPGAASQAPAAAPPSPSADSKGRKARP